ncbi:hypothetical protein [Psychromonas aquimarina]|uniref:hypothetical protein n=1 Tax=Psychromonas aquimarina TaxID=444919 RepID=UPI0003FC9E77|nr:hypothetical protein [Psychromonas aquimarina]
MQEHGSFTIRIVGQLIRVQAFGAWNYETAKRFCIEYKAAAQSLIQEPWACLLDLSKWELATPDIRGLVEERNLWANRNNQKYEVVVCRSPLQRYLIEKMLLNLNNIELNFFKEQSEALDWLRSVNFDLQCA